MADEIRTPTTIARFFLLPEKFGYTTADVIYRWNKERPAVAIAEDMKLSQFDLVDCPAGNYTDIVYKANAPDTNYDYDANQRTHYYNTKHGGGPGGGAGGGGGNKPSKALNTFAGPAAKNQHVRGTGIKLNNGIGQSSGGGGGGGVGGGGVIQFETDVASEYSMLIVNFHLQRHMGNFLIQVYGPCCLLVVLSWVSFWLNREATADRVSLGITTVLTMTFLGLEARTDLPKVPYPTALDFYVFLSFAFIFATILQFAVVHYFTKYGSGECYFIIEELDSDSADSEAETRAAAATAAGHVGVSSDFNVSTESQIYEVIPLSMCAIPMPSGSGKTSANSSCLGGGGSSGMSMRAMHQQRRNAALAAAANTKRRRWCFNWCRQRNEWRGGGGGVGGGDSDDDGGGICGFSFDCFGWRRRTRNRVDFDTSDEDDEERHLRAAEVATTSNAQAKPPGRRRMSFYRREELEARRKGKRTPQYNSVSKIDRASRIVFPLLFLVINVFYWYAYLSRSARILKHTSATATNTG